MKAKRIDHINLRIPEDRVDRAVEFYRDKLGFETAKLEEYKAGERTSFFIMTGETSMINIRPKKSFKKPDTKNFDHFCLVLAENIESIKEKLSKADIEIIRESKPLGSKGRAPAVYIRDPFNYKIEIKSAKT